MGCKTHEFRKLYIWQYKPKKALIVVGSFCTKCYRVDINLKAHALEIEKESDKYIDELILEQEQEIEVLLKKLEFKKKDLSPPKF